MQTEKQRLRAHYLEIRSGIPPGEYAAKSAAIRERILSWDLMQTIQTVHLYLAIRERNEVDTHPLIPEFLSRGLQVAVPVIQPGHQLKHVTINPNTIFREGRWSVMEPANGTEITPDALDLILVPMVAGDAAKQRIGYGKGFYDRFLEQTQAVKAGLLFECTRFSGYFPSESHDHPLDVLITEQARY